MPRKIATFLDHARMFYGDAFDVRKKRELSQSMSDWTDLADSEQRFTIAHLLYLNLEAEAGTHRLLTHTCQLLDELAEAFAAAVELSLEPEPEPDDEEDTDEIDDLDDAGEVFTPPTALPDVIDAEPAPADGGAG